MKLKIVKRTYNNIDDNYNLTMYVVMTKMWFKWSYLYPYFTSLEDAVTYAKYIKGDLTCSSTEVWKN